MSVPVIQFYFPADEGNTVYQQYQKLSDEDSERIMRFRNEGFAPMITVQRSCPPVNLLGYAWVNGEKELRNDWHDIPFPLVKCLIYWTFEIPERDYFLAKSYFECLLELREIPKEISMDQKHRIDALKPYTATGVVGFATKPATDEENFLKRMIMDTTMSDDDDGDNFDEEDFKLEDGRRVFQVIGGERQEKVNELIKALL